MTNIDEKKCSYCGTQVPDQDSTELCPSCGQTYWKCGSCGFLLTADSPPNTCPGCHKDCEFKNVTCYTPECGGPGNVDPRL